MLTTNTDKLEANSTTAKVGVVKIGQDLHAAQVTVVVQLDGSVPRRAQVIRIEQYLGWVRALRARYPEAKFHSCYEAGPCGYKLHRDLVALGVQNRVVAPTNLSGRRKTDKRDARHLVEALDRLVNGNAEALTVVQVPTPEQEEHRALVRQRTALVRQRRRSLQQGCSLLLQQGHRVNARWRAPALWATLVRELPGWVVTALEGWKALAEACDVQIQRTEQRIESLAETLGIRAPFGVGRLTFLTLQLELLDWKRFANRRQVGSFTGLCPSEFSSGQSRRQGSIDKHGNPRVRHALVEAAWRLSRHQPQYPPLRRLHAARDGRSRRKAIVAVARRLAIDLWRLATGRAEPAQLGLRFAPAS
ncbi:MAG: IS110 family transposase [Verrucomicrobia bacterium]|jgi:transposase|nr:IS110 family transposase [Verrucomicrobiota bacterium]